MKAPLIAAITLLILASMTPLSAKKLIHARGNEPLEIGANEGAILFREKIYPAKRAISLVLVRLPSESEPSPLDNVVTTDVGKEVSQAGDEYTFIGRLPPGSYVLAGTAYVDGGAALMLTCLCMGTVKFDIAAGKLTDMGMLLASAEDMPATFPEFDNLKLGRSFGAPLMQYVIALRPATEASSILVGGISVVTLPAEYQAFGKFPNLLGGTVNRLAPVPGILGYEADQVVDLKAR
jgi:hypothetical protein